MCLVPCIVGLSGAHPEGKGRHTSAALPTGPSDLKGGERPPPPPSHLMRVRGCEPEAGTVQTAPSQSALWATTQRRRGTRGCGSLVAHTSLNVLSH